jgi:hypothetical protein
MKFAHFSHIWAKPGMTSHQRYEELWRELQLCDELGFDYGFCVEHHFRPDESWMSSPSLYAVRARTRQQVVVFIRAAYAAHPARPVADAHHRDNALDAQIDGCDEDDGGAAIARAVDAEARGIDLGLRAAWTSATRL